MIIDKKKRTIYFGIALLVIAAALAIFSKIILIQIGEFLVMDEKPVCSDAIVVLSTGVEYYPRLIEAASLLRKGVAKRIMVNGNRKTDVIRGLEEKGFKRCCPWYENILRIFSLLGVFMRKPAWPNQVIPMFPLKLLLFIFSIIKYFQIFFFFFAQKHSFSYQIYF